MQNHTDKEEEIDLISVFNKIRAALERRRWLFLGFLLAGIGTGFLYYKLSPKTYKSRMIISSTAFQAPSFMVILDNINLLIEEGNHEELASALKISAEDAKKIGKLEMYSSRNYAREEFGDRIAFREDKVLALDDRREEFVIEAFVNDNTVFKTLEEGIVYYLNENPSIKASSAYKQEAHQAMKNSIKNQLVELDSLKKAIVQIMTEKKSANEKIYIGSPAAMYSELINLIHSEVNATEALMASKILVIESFHPYKKPASPKLGISLMVFTFVSMALFIAIVILLEGKRKNTLNKI